LPNSRGAGSNIGDALGFDPVENAVELGRADPKGVMMPFEPVPIAEIDGQLLVVPDRR
jgi:hypothetical protein